MEKRSKVATFVLFLIISLSCSSLRSLDSIKESDLVGTWQSRYSEVNGIDTLTLRSDGKFQQVFEGPDGYVYKSDWNEWHLERLADGRLRLHLEGMRYYSEGIELAESREPLYLFDESSQEDLIPGELMDNELILIVKVGAIFEAKNLVLRHLSYRDDSAQPTFTLINPASSNN